MQHFGIEKKQESVRLERPVIDPARPARGDVMAF